MKNQVKGYMFYVAFVAALGGFLFGFDTAVISGAEKAVQSIYELGDFSHGFTMATMLIGTIIGGLICGVPAERYGRRPLLRLIAVFYVVSALGAALIINWYSFMFFRFMGGLAVGASSVVGPMYIAELSPSNWRGRFVALFQFNVVLGILCAYLSNYYISGVPNDWQWMLGACAVPALVFWALLYTVPESPRWLVRHVGVEKARDILVKTGEPDVEREIAEIRQSLVTTGTEGGNLFQKQYRKPILIAFLIAAFSQLSGINAIIYYAPRIFEMSGVFRDGALMQSVMIGLTNLVFTMLGIFLIDKTGRKVLVFAGSVGMFIALAFVSVGFYAEIFTGYYMLACLMSFIAFFAMSIGATIWVVISEVFPNSVRSKGQVLGSMTHWAGAALVTLFFPLFLNMGGGTYVFGFFAVSMLFSIVFAIWMPETKNKTLEQIQKELI
jgi:sugar porter (SP) family MFS transporter